MAAAGHRPARRTAAATALALLAGACWTLPGTGPGEARGRVAAAFCQPPAASAAGAAGAPVRAPERSEAGRRGAAAAWLSALAGGAAPCAAQIVSFSDVKDGDAVASYAFDVAEAQIADEGQMLSDSARGYLTQVAAKLETNARTKLFLLTVPEFSAADGADVERTQFLRTMRLGLGIDSQSVLLVADRRSRAGPLQVSVGDQVSPAVSKEFVASVQRTFGSPDFVAKAGSEGALRAAFENLAACIFRAHVRAK
ncbi:unnamed protein product [Prorocentrum cordatum]|uniref:TPM domain-containing protein n=1 Tax=Prorocentrum cordatum TaxID=2364126 RepID=A0ABN9P8G9_9DINO|nr:unnamed protein product [Polarella glacialis]